MDTQTVARRVTSATVIGRREELAAIGAAVASARSGQPRIVLVGGEAGIGKTRLITEACAAAEQDGVLCAVGGCVQLGEASLPYAPLVEALRGLRRRFGEEEFSELLGPATRSVGVLLGIGEGGSVEQGRLFEQLLGLIGRLAAQQPMLIVFEDLHWADASTRDLVAFLGRNLRAAPAALVLTYRSDELHRRHPWWTVLAGLKRDPHVERLPVRGLSRPELVALLPQISDQRWSVEDLLHRTDGNPFYVEELVAAADIGGSVPPTLAELILARVNGLSDPTPALLHEAAVLGELVDDMWLVELSGRPLPVVMEALQEAVSHHLLTVDGAGCRFRHALVREALYDDLLPGERERLHAAAVRLLQADQRRVPEHVRQTLLAYHASAAGDVPTAFRASVRAGAECERVFALSAAAGQYERALSLWDRVADPVAVAGMTRSTLLLRAAETVFFGSGSDRAVALAEAAFAALPDQESPERRALMLERIGLIRVRLLQDQAAATAYERAVALVADRPPSSEKARALAGFGHYLMLHERHREAEPLLREAIAVADQVDARAVTGHALCSLGCVVVGLGRVEEGLAALRRAQEVSRENGSTADICRSYNNLSSALVQCARYDEADQCAADGVSYATETGNTFYGDGMIGTRISGFFRAGRWREAEQIRREVGNSAWLHGHWVSVLIGQGRLHEVRAIIDKLLEETADVDDVQLRGDALMRAGEFAKLEGRWDDARDLLAQGIAKGKATDDHFYRLLGYASAIRAERRRIQSVVGRRGAGEEIQHARQVADELIGQARDLAARFSADGIDLLPEPAAWLQTAEAEHAAARGNDTAQMWADVADTWDRVGQPYRNAEAQYRQADALLRQHGDRDRARSLAAAALEVAERLGAAPLAADIRQLAQRARLDLEPTPPHQPEPETGLAITAREAEVLALLATGRTNREIASTLYISEKTASVHVSNLLRKLGVGSRVEAAAIAQRLDLPHITSPHTRDDPPR